jgi:hypothetical protein
MRLLKKLKPFGNRRDRAFMAGIEDGRLGQGGPNYYYFGFSQKKRVAWGTIIFNPQERRKKSTCSIN